MNMYPVGEGVTWPMFVYRGTAKGLKSSTCLGQKGSRNPTLCTGQRNTK